MRQRGLLERLGGRPRRARRGSGSPALPSYLAACRRPPSARRSPAPAPRPASRRGSPAPRRRSRGRTTTSSTSTRSSSASAAPSAARALPASDQGDSVAGPGGDRLDHDRVRRSVYAAACRGEQPPGAWRCRPPRRPAWWPTCPSPARRRAAREPTYGTPASSHSAARVPSSPRGPCTPGTTTSQPRSTSSAAASPIGRSPPVPPGAVAVDGERQDLVAGRVERRRRPRPPRRGRRRARSSGRRRSRRPGPPVTAGAPQVRGAGRVPVDAGTDAGDDLVLDGARPARPVRDRRLAGVARAEDGHRLADPATGVSPRSTTTGPSRSGRRPGGARRRTSTSARPDAARGRPSAYPSGSRPRWVAPRCASGVAVADRRPGGDPRTWHQRGGQGQRGSQPWRAGRVDADQPGADPAQVWCVRGSVSVAAVAARWRTRGRSPAGAADARAPTRTGRGPARCAACAGVVGAGEVAHHPDDRGSARPLGRRAARHSAGQTSGSAPSRAIPVSRCRCTRGARRRPRRRRRGARGSARRGRRPAPTAAAKSASTGFSQLSTGASRPAARSAQGLVEAGDAEPGRAVGQRRPGDVDGAVAEPVGLDHRHQLAGARRRTAGCSRRRRRGRRPGWVARLEDCPMPGTSATLRVGEHASSWLPRWRLVTRAVRLHLRCRRPGPRYRAGAVRTRAGAAP